MIVNVEQKAPESLARSSVKLESPNTEHTIRQTSRWPQRPRNAHSGTASTVALIVTIRSVAGTGRDGSDLKQDFPSSVTCPHTQSRSSHWALARVSVVSVYCTYILKHKHQFIFIKRCIS